ncbi:MAG: AAA family ATPase [Candidatus Heimdallarchaeota archaeon]|nr:AAA family ATPase [Candidatus Heimdallarchaeota archaeon]
MKCPNCGTENPENANFCNNCAHSLTDVKPKQQEDRYTKYIPMALQKKLEESAKLGGIENERRIVTILFCDVVGSTKHAEGMDPEEWTEIINEAFDSIIPPVYKYEGIIARLMGDAILAFFGAPISHEDDPERAVLAGIDILEEASKSSIKIKEKWGIDIEVRVGINTGLVVVGEIGTDLRVEYTAMGDAINIASRMESTAESGTIQVTQNTFKHISYLFDVEKIGRIDVKGKSDPITTYKILNEKQSMDKNKKYSDRESVFVGRDEELNLLNTLIEGVENGEGKICWIAGEAGIGKSRLVTEFHNSLFLEDRVHSSTQEYDSSSRQIYWFETGALPYQVSSPFSPIIHFFINYFGVSLDMDNEEKYNLIKSKLAILPNGDDIFPFIANLLQIELTDEDRYQTAFLDPAILQEVTVQAIISFLDVFSKDTPLILIFDDIQWSDKSSLNLMNDLIRQVKSNKMLLIILSRAVPDPHDSLFLKITSELKDNFSLMEIPHLSEFGAAALISNILKVENLPQNVRERIITQSQGNPFYVEELVQSFIESGYLVNENGKWILKTDVSKLQIPETLNNLLMTRLDQLDEKSKRVAQSASVIGREFLFPILQCINDSSVELDDSISTLEDREWIINRLVDAKQSYFFKHVLSRDVAYNSLLFKRRKEIHVKIAECLRKIDSTMVDEIGRHLFEAEAFNDALPFIVKAAEMAITTNSTQEAISMLSQVEKNSDKVDDFMGMTSAYVTLGTAYAMQGNVEQSTKYYSSLLDKSQEANNQHGEVRALNKLAENALYMSHDPTKADEYLEKAEKIGSLINFPEGLLETSAVRCVMHQALGEFDISAEYEIKGTKLSEDLNIGVANISFKYNLIVSYVLSLKLEGAEKLIEDFFEEYETKGEKYYVASIYGYLYPALLYLKGDLKEAIESSKKGIKLAKEIKAPFPLYLASRSLGEIFNYTGDFHEAEHYFETAAEQATKNPSFGFLASSKLSLATIRTMIGREDKDLFEEGLKDMEARGATYWGARSWGEIGYYYLYTKDYQESRNKFDLSLSKPSAPFYLYKAYNLLGKTRLCIMEEKYDEASSLIAEVGDFSEEFGIKLFYAECKFLSGLINFKMKSYPEALTSFEESLLLSSEYGQKQLTLETLSYTIKTHQILNRAKSLIKLQQQFLDLFNELSNQFDSEDKKEAYISSMKDLNPN